MAAALTTKLVKDSGCYRLAQAIRRRFTGTHTSSLTPVSNESRDRLAGDVVTRYAANVQVVERLGRTYGFRPVFFWQPTIFTKPALVPVEREEAQRYAWTEPMFRAVYERIRSSTELNQNPAFHDLSGIFDGADGLTFIDYCHTTESANARIAGAMADHTSKELSRRPLSN
jgi:hypothetical protein